MSDLECRRVRIPRFRIIAILVLAVGSVSGFATRVGASTITVPSGPPRVDANAPLTVVATGFRPSENVYIEQCDGVPPSALRWSPTLDCDNGSSPPAVIADAQGTATFSGDDLSRAFRPFEGESPSSLFNCMSAGKRPPNNQLATFTNCKVRVSSNNASATGDQVFLPIVLTGHSVPSGSSSVPSSTTTLPHTSGTTSAKAAAATAAGHARAKRASKRGASAKPGHPSATARPAIVPAVAPATAPAASKNKSGAGLGALSDSGVRTGYLLLLLGLVIAFVPLVVRSSARRRGR
jgi:hypothetical protein